MNAVATRMTAEQYLAVEYGDDRWRELIDGVVVVNEPLPIHALFQLRLLRAIDSWIEAEPGRGLVLPPADIVMSEHDVYAPDLLWLSERNVPDSLDRRLDGVPDLAVEIRSPSTWRYDVGRKRSVYEERGLGELWLVDGTSRTVLVFRRSGPTAPGFDVALELSEGEVVASSALPGFGLEVAELFAPHRG
ncbi:MAG: Uma2 family endonuclease [Solirubrobacteraceae bacterium]